MDDTLKEIVELSDADYQTLANYGSVTVDGITIQYTPKISVYVTPDDTLEKAKAYTDEKVASAGAKLYSHAIQIEIRRMGANGFQGDVVQASVYSTREDEYTIDDVEEVLDGKQVFGFRTLEDGDFYTFTGIFTTQAALADGFIAIEPAVCSNGDMDAYLGYEDYYDVIVTDTVTEA